ncbi:MAG: hypothetical protein FJ302_00830 [Planctomycetes bacterium]|nr:hypothetical protein [Planctomycetota bacterium]
MREELSKELNHTSKAMLARRNFGETLAVYIVCAAALSYMVIAEWGSAGRIIAVLIVILFALLTDKRLQPLGPHECQGDRRIIYRTLCPYGQPAKGGV